MVRYTGEFVVEDIANGRKYLADLLYAFERGDDLTGWVLFGNTVPTIDAATGDISLDDATPAGGTSVAVRNLAPERSLNAALSMDITRQNDDTSTHTYAGIHWMQAYSLGDELTGVCLWIRANVPQRRYFWYGSGGNGPDVIVAGLPTA